MIVLGFDPLDPDADSLPTELQAVTKVYSANHFLHIKFDSFSLFILHFLLKNRIHSHFY